MTNPMKKPRKRSDKKILLYKFTARALELDCKGTVPGQGTFPEIAARPDYIKYFAEEAEKQKH